MFDSTTVQSTRTVRPVSTLSCCAAPTTTRLTLLQGRRLESLEVGVERRPRGQFVGDAEAAEGAVTTRVGEMEDQRAVAEAIHLLDQQDAQDLLGAQSPRATAALRQGAGGAGGAQVLQDKLLDPRMIVEEPRDCSQLCGVIDIEPVFVQAELSFSGFAHSGWPLFLPKLF
jgi:hypothetical protein